MESERQETLEDVHQNVPKSIKTCQFEPYQLHYMREIDHFHPIYTK